MSWSFSTVGAESPACAPDHALVSAAPQLSQGRTPVPACHARTVARGQGLEPIRAGWTRCCRPAHCNGERRLGRLVETYAADDCPTFDLAVTAIEIVAVQLAGARGAGIANLGRWRSLAKTDALRAVGAGIACVLVGNDARRSTKHADAFNRASGAGACGGVDLRHSSAPRALDTVTQLRVVPCSAARTDAESECDEHAASLHSLPSA